MYHTKRCPKFLLLPKCPKLKQVTESPHCKQKVTSYKIEAHTAGHLHSAARAGASGIFMCLYKNAYQYISQIYFHYKANEYTFYNK